MCLCSLLRGIGIGGGGVNIFVTLLAHHFSIEFDHTITSILSMTAPSLSVIKIRSVSQCAFEVTNSDNLDWNE